MPTVPTASPQQALQGIPSARIQTPTPDVGFQRIAEAGVSVASRIAQRQKTDIDKAMVLDADYQLSLLKTDLESERSQYKGSEAVERVPEIDAKFKIASDEILQSLGNEEQKASVKGLIQNHGARLYDGNVKYADSETASFIQDRFDASTDLLTKIAVDNSHDEEEFDLTKKKLKAIIDDQLKGQPLVAADTYNDILDTINKGVNQRKIEAERESKIQKEINREESNKELSGLAVESALTWKEIKNREEFLNASDIERWRKEYNASLARKEKSTGKIIVDADLKRELEVEGMQFPINATDDDYIAYAMRVSKAVEEEKLDTKSARAMMTDASNNRKIDPARRESVKNITTFLGNDYNDEMFGEVGTLEARAEYNRQVSSLNEWAKKNKDKEPIEYYERISMPYKTKKFFGLIDFMSPNLQKGRLEIESGDKREQAIKALKNNGSAITENNINFVMEQL